MLLKPNRRKPASQLLLGQPLHRVIAHEATGRRIEEWRSISTPGWRVLNGPAKESLDLVEDESVNCVVTSPPYFWLRDYKVDGQIGLEDSVDGYVAALKEVMAKVKTKLRREGVL